MGKIIQFSWYQMRNDFAIQSVQWNSFLWNAGFFVLLFLLFLFSRRTRFAASTSKWFFDRAITVVSGFFFKV